MELHKQESHINLFANEVTMDERTKGILLMILASIGFGSYSLIIKFLSPKFSPITLSFAVYLLSFLFILPLFVHTKKVSEFSQASSKVKLLAISVGFFGIILGWLSFIYAIGFIGPTLSTTIVQMQPIFVLLLGWIFLKEKVNRKELFATCLILIAILMMGLGNADFNVTAQGIILSLLSCFSFAICTVLGRYLTQSLSSLTILTIRIISGTILLIPLLLFANVNELFTISFNDFLLLMGIVVTGTLVPYLLYYESLKRIKAILGSLIEVFAPIITAIGSYFLFAEVLALFQYLGILLAIVGVVIITASKEKN